MEYSNVYTAQPSIPAPVWALRFASESSNASEVESGWSRNLEEVQRFSLRSRTEAARADKPTDAVYCILLVEDNPADVGLVREALDEHSVDCELLLINNGERAIRFIADADTQRTRCPDLVILDLNLPKKPGRDVLEKIRESRNWKHVPVAVVTSSDAPKDKDEAGRLGASRYVRKPSRLANFLELGAVFKAMLEGGRNAD